MQQSNPPRRRLIDATMMFMVLGLSLLLLIYVGFSEAKRTYQQFQIEKLEAQGKIVQNAFDSFLRAGLPLRQFVGFTALTERILASDQSIAAMTAFDRAGNPIFTAGIEGIPLLPIVEGGTTEGFELRMTDQYQQVVLPLSNRFETVGSLAVAMPNSVVATRVESAFEPLLAVAVCLSAAFALFVSLAEAPVTRGRTPWLQIVYAMTFLGMALFVIGTLVALYSEGAQSKAKALADSLGQRLSVIMTINVNIDQIDGLDSIFGDYRRLYPDISAAGLIVDGVVHVHTDQSAVKQPWVSEPATYEYIVDLSRPDSGRSVKLAVALPSDVVIRRVLRSVKNFAALFVASGFLAGLFLQLAGSVQKQASGEVGSETRGAQNDIATLNLVKPVFFVAVFLEHLNYAFLPQFMHEVAAASGLSSGYASAPFTAYYLCFALALIPAGHYAQNRDARPLMHGGLVLAAAGVLALAVPVDFYVVTAARALSGIGQGMLFIGVQSYILAMASPGGKTRGAAIIVFGFQGGMISGMAIGSLLVTYMGAKGVFVLGGMIATVMALYALMVLPSTAPQRAVEVGLGATLRRLGRDVGQVLRSMHFLQTMFFIGIPAKAVLTGIIIFALPLLLASKQYQQEDIGQIIMVYAAGVVIASSYVSRLVDRTGKTDTILFWGAVISGIGLMAVGLIDWEVLNKAGDGKMSTVVLIIGVAIVGIAHGFINAPVVTHVAESELAAKIGAASVTATYRFLERIGHVAGPVIVGQLFFFWGQSAVNLMWIGVVIAFLGVLFLARSTQQWASTT
ncbi:MAG: MFS transporter [Inquilinus sp.]|nr:MFS transporter [Inquilinus sp.]